ncbi:MAG: endo-1,4-beta-xylanase [Pseudomonadota bacterium]
MGCAASTGDADDSAAGSSNVAGSVGVAGSPPTAGSGAVGGSATTGAAGQLGTSGAAGAYSAGGASPAGGAGGGGAGAGGSSGRGGSGGHAGGGSAGSSGSAGAGGALSLPKFVGNITTGNSIDTGGMTYSKYWDQISPENAGKWGSVQQSASGAFNWTTLDSIYAYAETNKIIFKQHNFVWGSQQPSGSPTEAQVENWIKSFCQRYPNTKLIDVVNEPPPHTTPSYTAALGAGETGTYGWITKAFKLARQYCGNAILILNDYNNIENGDENHFIDIVTQIKAAGAPIDAVGCQAHGLAGMSATTLQTNLDTMATKTGLPIYITEYDINNANDATQLSVFQTQIPIFRKTAAVHGVTIWGWIAGRTWETNSGLVKGTTPRSAMTWLMTELGRPVPPN